MNSRPSTPLCPNCLMTEIYCQAVGWPDTGEKCCSQCEHYSLEPSPERA